jgi:hypothetical protein
MNGAICTNDRVPREGVLGTVGSWIDLMRSKEHGKTARTIAITMCVVGAIAAISSAATIQRYFLRGATRPAVGRGRTKRLTKRSNGRLSLPRTRSLARTH